MSFDTINLEGLFGDNLILYNRIINDFYSRILKINTTSSISCNVLFDKIELRNSFNCNINIINKCISNNSNSLNIFLKTLIDNKKFMSDEIRKKIEKNLDINLDIDADQQVNSGFMKRCNISSTVSNIIVIKNLIIQNCTGILNSSFLFYNTGDVNSNCGINELTNAISTKDKQTKQIDLIYYLNKVLFLNLSDIFILIFFITIVLLAVLLIKTLFFSKNIKYFVSKYLLKNFLKNVT